VVGLMNVQFAIQDDKVYVLEVNPRASRTVPYVSKAIGVPLAKVAARCMVGQSLASQKITKEVIPPYYCVKEAVFPFIKFPGVDTILGPEMKSTGEVMGVGRTFAEAFVKSQLAAGVRLPKGGKVFLSVRNADKPRLIDIACRAQRVRPEREQNPSEQSCAPRPRLPDSALRQLGRRRHRSDRSWGHLFTPYACSTIVRAGVAKLSSGESRPLRSSAAQKLLVT